MNGNTSIKESYLNSQNKRHTVVRRYLSFGSLSLAFMALPFSVQVCHIALILFLILWLTEGKWAEKFSVIRSNTTIQLILAFSVLQLIGLFYTENTAEGWFAIEKKVFFFLIPIALATTFIRFEKKEIYQMFFLFTLACVVGSFICIGSAYNEFVSLQQGEISAEQLNYLKGSPFINSDSLMSDPWLVFSYVELSNGIDIHPTYFSLYLAFCVIVLFFRLFSPDVSRKEKIWIRVIIFYFTVFIVSLSSRIVILSLLVLYVFMLGESLIGKRPKTISWSLFALIFILAFTLFLNPISRYRNIKEIASSSYNIQPNSVYTTSTEIRASLWWLGVQSLSKINPVWGTGTGDVDDTMQSISEEYDVKNVLGSYDPHNEFLYILLGNGVISLIVFISFLAIPFRSAWMKKDYLLMAFIFLFVSLCLTETILERQKGIVFFALVFPLLALQQKPTTENKVE